jgi:hypothetical protein
MLAHRISSVIITFLILAPGFMSSSSLAQTDDDSGNKGNYFNIYYPIPGTTLNGTINMYGTMQNDTVHVIIEVDKQFTGYATLDRTNMSWYFFWKTTNTSNGFHWLRIIPTYRRLSFIWPYSRIYVLNPYPSLIEKPIGPQSSARNVQYRDVKMAYSVPNLTDINMEYAMFLWDFGDDTGDSGRSVTHTYYTDGNYTISLQVINDKRNIKIQQEVEVINQPAPQRAQEKHDGKLPTNILMSMVFLLFMGSMCLFIFKDLRRR